LSSPTETSFFLFGDKGFGCTSGVTARNRNDEQGALEQVHGIAADFQRVGIRYSERNVWGVFSDPKQNLKGCFLQPVSPFLSRLL
jgi:hypothetical protein